jgi:hypothetical protein
VVKTPILGEIEEEEEMTLLLPFKKSMPVLLALTVEWVETARTLGAIEM